MLLKLEQEGAIASESGTIAEHVSTGLTRAWRGQFQAEARNCEQTGALIGRFFTLKAEDLQ